MSLLSDLKVIHDISPIISPRTGVFPGDTRFLRNIALDMKKGDNLTLSSITSTLHLGAHADAPSHYKKDGASIGDRSLEIYLGSCLVIRADVGRGQRVSQEHLRGDWARAGKAIAPRLLVATGSFPNPDSWNSDFAAFSPSLLRDFAEAGVRLVGIDTPSVDLEDSKDLPAHAILAHYDMAVLEGLVLDGVETGIYDLVALPLRLADADASPVRAILLR